MISVLFICEHNSARSQIAEAYLNKYGAGKFTVESAGLEAGVLNPLVVEALFEEGIDISKNSAKSVTRFHQQERQFDIIITLCSPEVGEKCPVFPGKAQRLNWPFPNPSRLSGEPEKVMAGLRTIRNQIKYKVLDFVTAHDEEGPGILYEQVES